MRHWVYKDEKTTSRFQWSSAIVIGGGSRGLTCKQITTRQQGKWYWRGIEKGLPWHPREWRSFCIMEFRCWDTQTDNVWTRPKELFTWRREVLPSWWWQERNPVRWGTKVTPWQMGMKNVLLVRINPATGICVQILRHGNYLLFSSLALFLTFK